MMICALAERAKTNRQNIQSGRRTPVFIGVLKADYRPATEAGMVGLISLFIHSANCCWRQTESLASSLLEPECRTGFPACRFTGLSSPADQRRATRKSPEPAGWKACATSQSRFVVPMHAEKRKEAFHEPPGDGTGPTGCRPGPLTRRAVRFLVPIRAKKRGGFTRT